MNREELKEKRRILLKNASKVSHVKKGNRKYTGQKICSVCGKTLAIYDYDNKHYEAINGYKLLDCQVLKVTICENIETCVSYAKKKGLIN